MHFWTAALLPASADRGENNKELHFWSRPFFRAFLRAKFCAKKQKMEGLLFPSFHTLPSADWPGQASSTSFALSLCTPYAKRIHSQRQLERVAGFSLVVFAMVDAYDDASGI